ncbi:MAG: glycolate oxidase subunit GlcE [Alphaproteobacteria bacterium]|nr:glycolate oxidase subunit GlcE [Alphaproteobacteria bacterium]
MTHFTPETPDQVREAVAWAVSEGAPLSVRGAGTKASVGRPINTSHELDLSRLTGITLYEAEELILQAWAGTPMSEIEAALSARNQRLEFEPPNYAALLKSDKGAGTLGGAVAANLAGPRRIKSGAARDHFLGFEAVSGRGEDFKSGGRVVKNVTGYDLCKLMAGSWGTLGVMTRITVKVMPVAEKQRTVLLATDDPETAVRALTEGLNSPYDLSGAAWVPTAIAARSGLSLISGQGSGVAALRLDGPGPSVEYRCEKLRQMLGVHGPTDELHSRNSAGFWREIRDVAPFSASDDLRAVWRLSTAPSEGAALYGSVMALPGAEAFLDWGGGLIWLAVEGAGDAGAEAIRTALQAHGGHATLIRGGADLRAAVEPFQPLKPGVRRLTEKIKQAFDPSGVLNPGRMYDGV